MTHLAVIGGSGAYDLLQHGAFTLRETLGPRETPFGPSAPVHRLAAGAAEVLFLSRHGERGYHRTARFVNYRANLYALRDLGAERVVGWSGPGALDATLALGQYVVPDDVLDETRARDDTFFTGGGLGFIRQSPVFCPTLRAGVLAALAGSGTAVRDGAVYACTEGPRLETPAEIRKLRILGADLVGMTLCPEVFLAKELAMCYAAACYITNYAEGMVDRAFQPGVLFEGLLTAEEKRAVDAAVEGFAGFVERLAAEEPAPCHCRRLLERYQKRGTIGGDWREWVGR